MTAATAIANAASAQAAARRRADRHENLAFLAAHGCTLDEAAARLGLTVAAVWVFCKRHGHGDLYETLAARQRRTGNQYRRAS